MKKLGAEFCSSTKGDSRFYCLRTDVNAPGEIIGDNDRKYTPSPFGYPIKL